MSDPKILNGTTWLCEAVRLRAHALRALRMPTCPTGREVVEARRLGLEAARAVPKLALEGTGVADAAEEQLAANGGKAIRAARGKVAVIPVYGPVAQRTSPELMKTGGTSLEEVGAAFDACLADPSIQAVVLQFDSPGGGSYGVEELADKIYAARGRKKTYSIADSMMCSASYWLGTAAEVVCCTPGGDVGSVGVYAMHVDESRALEDAGLTVTLVTAGRYKAELSSHKPLSDDARAYVQEQVNATYAKFTAALARNRGVPQSAVRDKFGQGRVVNAGDALAAGMADRVISFDDLLTKLTGRDATEPAPARAAAGAGVVEVMRLRHDRQKRRTRELLCDRPAVPEPTLPTSGPPSAGTPHA